MTVPLSVQILELERKGVLRVKNPHSPSDVAEMLDVRPSVIQLEAALERAFISHEDHRVENPGHRGLCQDTRPTPRRLSELLFKELAQPTKVTPPSQIDYTKHFPYAEEALRRRQASARRGPVWDPTISEALALDGVVAWAVRAAAPGSVLAEEAKDAETLLKRVAARLGD